MNQEKICLASDNFTGAHPSAIEAITIANRGNAPSYGSDVWTEKAIELIQKAFNAKPKVFFTPNGTGANVFALTLCCKRHESVICSDIAHIHYHESGAAESMVGCKLLTVPNKEGKVTPEEIVHKLKKERAFGKHSTAPRVLSITQPTEVGTVYTLDELRALSALCKQENLLFHIDGCRIYNAAEFLGCSLADITTAASLDILSLGGTKNGLLFAEAVLIFNPSLEDGSDHIHKQNLQLLSKMRYVSAQYIALFTDNLWQKLASAANLKAQQIAKLVKANVKFTVSYPVETNQIFFTVPKDSIPKLQEKILCYPWDAEKNELRFVTSWNTSDEDVKGVEQILIELFS